MKQPVLVHEMSWSKETNCKSTWCTSFLTRTGNEFSIAFRKNWKCSKTMVYGKPNDLVFKSLLPYAIINQLNINQKKL